ncbi:MAG: hypothetical protein P0Y64_13710 [Candidatus Sphingomonas colombiensis]|nr:hypothetical protein [Sphingomonas sp.]WEK42439.1 MAG: hypothetical protein P0Y64_13710 [Sphingomonas sp.]
MVGPAVFTYGLLMSFIFAGASRNAKLRRPNPPMIQYTGYIMCGLTGALSVILFAVATLGFFGTPLI